MSELNVGEREIQMPLHLKQSACNGETISRDSRINWTHKARNWERKRERAELGSMWKGWGRARKRASYRKFVCSRIELPLNLCITWILVLPFVLLPHTKDKQHSRQTDCTEWPNPTGSEPANNSHSSTEFDPAQPSLSLSKCSTGSQLQSAWDALATVLISSLWLHY